MQKLFTNKIINIAFLFIFCISFTNIQNLKALSISAILNSYFGVVSTLPTDQQIPVVNSTLPGLLKRISDISFGGYSYFSNPLVTTQVSPNTSSVQQIQNSPVCNSNNTLYYDQAQCDILVAKAQANDFQKLEIQKLQNSISSPNPTLPTPNNNQTAQETQVQQLPLQAQQPAVLNNSNGLQLVSSEFEAPVISVYDQTGNTSNDGAIPEGLNNVTITPQCQDKFANLGPGCSDLAGLKPIVVLSLKQACSVLGKPVAITSAHRSTSCNESVNGAPKSQHKDGLAVDIVPNQIGDFAKQLRVFLIFKKNGAKGIGCYNINKAHLDFRATPAKWGKNYRSDTFNVSNCPPALVQAFKN